MHYNAVGYYSGSRSTQLLCSLRYNYLYYMANSRLEIEKRCSTVDSQLDKSNKGSRLQEDSVLKYDGSRM